MADTMRSLSALQTLLADNTAGDISAQDVRDFLVSAYQSQGVNGFRLTLETGVPVSTSDQTSKTTVYWTPYLHNRVGVYDGTSWKQYTSAELSLALGTLTSGKNYDVFLYDNSGTLTLKLGPAWSSDTSRGTGAGTTELATQDGVYVNNVSIASGPGAKAGLYLGTIRTTSTTTTEDSGGGTTTNVGGKRFLWNAYNRVLRPMSVIDTTSTWTYSGTTYQQARAQSGNKVEYVCGLAADSVRAVVAGQIYMSGGSAQGATFAVGVDSTTARSGLGQSGYTGSVEVDGPASAFYDGIPGLGYHYLAWLEKATAGTPTLAGATTGGRQLGLTATVFA